MQELIQSKKFIAAVIAVVAQMVGVFGLDIDQGAMLKTVSPLMVYIVGQGWADTGKEAAKINGR